MSGGGNLPNASNMTEGYDSTSDEEFEIILPPQNSYVSCAKCKRLFRYRAEFLHHVEGCMAREMARERSKEQKGKGHHDQNAVQRGEVEGPSVVPLRALNLFNDPLELRLAPPGPPPPPPSVDLDLSLATGRNKSGGFRQQLKNNKGVGPSDGNVGKNFKM